MIPVIVLASLALVAAAVCLWQLQQMKRRLALSLAASDGTSLEKTLQSQHQQVAAVASDLEKLQQAQAKTAETLELASRKVSIVRFNPFGDTGGDQSFALAVLDGHDSGYVLTSIHGRSGTRVYVKPIDFGKSKYKLSAEEERALKQAGQRTLTGDDK